MSAWDDDNNNYKDNKNKENKESKTDEWSITIYRKRS
jgi:hypothetical protein